MSDGFVIKDGILEAYTLREPFVTVPDGVHTIGRGAFKGCALMEGVILPESVRSIKEHGFKGCRKLKTIQIPPHLEEVGEYAFHRCHSLKSIRLPQEVKRLGDCVFLLCDGLEEISIPGVTELGRQVFLNDVNLRRLEISKDLNPDCIRDVFTADSKLECIYVSGEEVCFDNIIEVLDSETANPLIKAIARDVLSYMEIKDGILMSFLTNIKNVDLPYGIKGIGKSAFFDKKGITTVKLPETIREIGEKAFRNCINLEHVEFSCKAPEISKDAFKNCTTLKYITLFDGTEYELKGLPNSLDPTLPSIVGTIHSQLLSNFFISGTALLEYRGSEERVVIPEGITIIGERAFEGNEAVGRVVLPNSIREIHEGAFAGCVMLQTINLPEGLNILGDYSFENCLKLIRAELPASITKIGISVFNRCKKLNEVLLGKDTEKIENLAFYGCESLKNITFPNKLQVIGDLAFYKCTSLKEVRFPKSIKTLGSNIFTMSGVRSAVVEGRIREQGTDIFSQCTRLKKLEFEEGIREIGDKFAYSCSSLKYINLPSTLEYIGKDAFEGSIWRREWEEAGSWRNIFLDGTKAIGEVIIPEGITAIAGGAFYGNKEVTSVKLPNSLKRIGAKAFCGCISLKHILLPPEVTELEEGVFSYCSSLESVESLGQIYTIQDKAFYGCSRLEKVPSENLGFIGDFGFQGCESLKILKLDNPEIKENVFLHTPFLENMKAETSLVTLGTSVIDGKSCKGYLLISEGITEISPYAFEYNEDLIGVILPKSLKNIEKGAFIGCKNLREIKIQAKVEKIGKSTFEKCLSLESIAGDIEILEDRAFAFCPQLKDADLGRIQILGKEAFIGCYSLERCKSEDVNTIGEGCFLGCSALKEFNFNKTICIGRSAFMDCSSLNSISLKEGIFIGAHSFENCDCLEEINLTKGEIQCGSYAFSGCTTLKTVRIGEKSYKTNHYLVLFDREIPDCIKTIYTSALSCFSIDETFSLYAYKNWGRVVHIPDGIKRIEGEVFRDAVNLKELAVPESVEYIGPRAFDGTRWIEKLRERSPMVIVNGILVDGRRCEGEIVIPEDVKFVSGWAFVNCNDLTGVRYSSRKTITEEYAFRNCLNLKQVIDANGMTYKLEHLSDREADGIPGQVKQIFKDCYHCFKTDKSQMLIECTGNIGRMKLAEGITAIGEEVFQDGNLLTEITLADTITSIGKRAFERCKWLVSIRNAKEVTRIEKHAFSGCVTLEEIELSEKLTFLGAGAFENCTQLKSIRIPEGITEISERTFFRCHSLKTIYLPKSLKSVGREAFGFCYGLEEIHFPKGLKKIESRAFVWCTGLKIADIPENTEKETDSFGLCGL